MNSLSGACAPIGAKTTRVRIELMFMRCLMLGAGEWYDVKRIDVPPSLQPKAKAKNEPELLKTAPNLTRA